MLKLKLQYFGHLMWRADSLKKTLMLGQIECGRRRGWQRMRWLAGITDSKDVSLSMNREAWHAAVHGVTKSWTQLSEWIELNSAQVLMKRYILTVEPRPMWCRHHVSPSLTPPQSQPPIVSLHRLWLGTCAGEDDSGKQWYLLSLTGPQARLQFLWREGFEADRIWQT